MSSNIISPVLPSAVESLSLKPLSASPIASPQDGDIYYNSGTNQFNFYQNGTWVNLGGGATGIAARYGLTGSQSIPGSTITTILFDTLDIDTASAYNTSTGVYTVPAGGSGNYILYSLVSTSSLASNGEMDLYFEVNGTILTVSPDKNVGASANAVFPKANDLISLTAGDTLLFRCFTSAGATIGGDPRSNYFYLVRQT